MKYNRIGPVRNRNWNGPNDLIVLVFWSEQNTVVHFVIIQFDRRATQGKDEHIATLSWFRL